MQIKFWETRTESFLNREVSFKRLSKHESLGYERKIEEDEDDIDNFAPLVKAKSLGLDWSRKS
jgi:hypothetical protein